MPLPKKVKTDDSYEVGSKDVFLSLSIGEGQFGTTDVSVGSTKIIRTSGPIGNLRLGSGPSIQGQRLLITSLVSDVSTMTNRMSVSYRLKGGTAQKTLVAKGVVEGQGDALIFDTKIALT